MRLRRINVPRVKVEWSSGSGDSILVSEGSLFFCPVLVISVRLSGPPTPITAMSFIDFLKGETAARYLLSDLATKLIAAGIFALQWNYMTMRRACCPLIAVAMCQGRTQLTGSIIPLVLANVTRSLYWLKISFNRSWRSEEEVRAV